MSNHGGSHYSYMTITENQFLGSGSVKKTALEMCPFIGVVPEPPLKLRFLGWSSLQNLLSDRLSKIVLLREPRLKSNNRGGALSQSPLKTTHLNMLLPPHDSAAEHHC
jgi:hypothetical protein